MRLCSRDLMLFICASSTSSPVILQLFKGDAASPQVLEDCVAASMQAACKRLAGGLAQTCPEGTCPEERLTAVARGIDVLFGDITARYTPLLCGDVFNAVSLAAEQLYRMLTPQVQAWLCRGGNSWN